MWAFAWRFGVFVLGLLWVRGALYTKRWGHGGPVVAGIQGLVGLAMCLPLWRHLPGSRGLLVVLGVVVLAPWRQIAVTLVERRFRNGLASLASEWRTLKEEDGGLIQVRRPPGEDAREAWVGNVLTHVRSLHPSVSTSETYRMMGFVVRLEHAPRLRCTLTRGWSDPKYHEKEWTENTVMQGQMMGLSMGDLLAEGGRETGGSVEELTEEPAVTDPRFESFYSVRCTDPDSFSDAFSGEILEEFFGCASSAVQFECNVTPSSVNIYTVYLGEKEQRRNLAFLDRLADSVSSSRGDFPDIAKS